MCRDSGMIAQASLVTAVEQAAEGIVKGHDYSRFTGRDRAKPRSKRLARDSHCSIQPALFHGMTRRLATARRTLEHWNFLSAPLVCVRAAWVERAPRRRRQRIGYLAGDGRARLACHL